jgi:hypothetical protein
MATREELRRAYKTGQKKSQSWGRKIDTPDDGAPGSIDGEANKFSHDKGLYNAFLDGWSNFDNDNFEWVIRYATDDELRNIVKRLRLERVTSSDPEWFDQLIDDIEDRLEASANAARGK